MSQWIVFISISVLFSNSIVICTCCIKSCVYMLCKVLCTCTCMHTLCLLFIVCVCVFLFAFCICTTPWSSLSFAGYSTIIHQEFYILINKISWQNSHTVIYWKAGGCDHKQHIQNIQNSWKWNTHLWIQSENEKHSWSKYTKTTKNKRQNTNKTYFFFRLIRELTPTSFSRTLCRSRRPAKFSTLSWSLCSWATTLMALKFKLLYSTASSP